MQKISEIDKMKEELKKYFRRYLKKQMDEIKKENEKSIIRVLARNLETI